MKVIHAWLADYLEKFHQSPERLSQLLTGRAVEVDDIQDVKEKLQPLVVGKVLVLEKHPKADRLKIAQVSIGAKRLSVVCGAPNVRESMFVVVAQPGQFTLQPDTGEWREISVATVRGVSSEGILCGADELGLASGPAAHQERHILDLSEFASDRSVGKSVVEVLDVSPVYDLDVLANRPDLLGHRGVAKEIAGLLHLKYKEPKHPLPKPRSKTLSLRFEIQAMRLTPRYAGLLLNGIEFKASPAWMQHRLRRAGIRPINLVVDVTNYVMLDVGQPLHAFDLDKVHQFMRVREARHSEQLKTLDGKQHSLPQGAIVIEDQQGLIDLAGIMGGESSMITEKTRRIFLQAAIFDSQRIRTTSKTLGHRTEASSRFEKGIAQILTQPALELSYYLLKQSLPQLQLEAQLDVHAPTPKTTVIHLRIAKLNSLLGSNFSISIVERILKDLGFHITHKSTDSLKVKPATHRLDLQIEEDVIEEVGRAVDYNSLPATAPHIMLKPQTTSENIRLRPMIFSSLTANGWNEVMQLSFTNEPFLKKFGRTSKQSVRILNPMSEDQAVLRSELITSLLGLMKEQVRSIPEPKIFEFAHIFLPYAQSYAEIPHLVGMTVGHRSFTQVKGMVEYLLQRLHISEYRFEPATHWAFHPDSCLRIALGKETLGTLGLLQPDLGQAGALSQPVAAFEISYDQLIHATSPRFTFQDMSNFPSILLDIAVVIPTQVSWQEVASEVRRHAGPCLKRLEPFDVYTGDPIPDGKKNLAFRVEFQAPDRTLDMTEAELQRTKIVDGLQAKWGANLR